MLKAKDRPFPTGQCKWWSRFLLSAAAGFFTVTGCAPARTTEVAGSGGETKAGGQTGSGGKGQSGGSGATGGISGSAGGVAQGGSAYGGGPKGTGGGGPGGSVGSGGSAVSSGGTGGAGGAGGGSAGGKNADAAAGGQVGSGGAGTSTGAGGAAAGGSSGSGRTGPCDIYQAANTPCVSAHSTVRALYGAYTGPLYQVRKGGDVKDIPVGADGYVDISVQDSFCSGGGCTISTLYDQSPQKNDLIKSPKALWLPNGGMEANANDGKITINGHTAHGIFVDNSGGSTGVGYRNNATKGLAKGDEAESMYMVVDGKRFNQWCCFDYGNAETSGRDDGDATMECLYWGNSTQWTRGGGNGPWMAADLENGMFEGDSKNTPSNTSITGWAYVTGFLKGPSGNAMVIKAGNAQAGKLEIKWDGKRPPGYSPMKKQGAIILGTGGDGSNNAKGTFFEGVITIGNPPDAVDDAVEANIVAAGYGK